MLARLRVLHRGSTLKASRGGIALGEGAAAGAEAVLVNC